MNSMQRRWVDVIIVLAVCFLKTTASGQELICGNNYNLLICRDSVIRIWGTNEYGILAASSTDTSVHSNIIDTMGPIKSVWPGKYHVVVQRQNGTFWTWGRRFFDIRRDDDFVGTDSIPVPIDLPNTVVKVSFGESHCALLHSDGTLTTWGVGSFGRLGNGSESSSFDTFQKVPISDVVDVVCGQYHCLALKRDGTLWTWGMNSSGSLGIGRTPDRSTLPVHIDSVPPIAKIAVGWNILVGPSHTLALDSSGFIWTWGANEDGQLGNGTTTVGRVPHRLDGLTRVVDVACGGGFSCSLDSAGQVWTWGANFWHQLGMDVGKYASLPIRLNGLDEVAEVHTGDFHTIVKKRDNSWFGWGLSVYNQILASTSALFLPVTAIPLECISTSVFESHDSDHMRLVYPNPTDGRIRIERSEYSYHSESSSLVRVVSANGEEFVVSAAQTPEAMELDLSDYPDGVYLVVVRNRSSTEAFKVVLIR